jgi:hypothetical protein
MRTRPVIDAIYDSNLDWNIKIQLHRAKNLVRALFYFYGILISSVESRLKRFIK